MVKNIIPKPPPLLGNRVAKHARNAERAFDALFDFKPLQDKDLFWQPGLDKETNPFVGSHPLDDTFDTPARPVTKQRTIQELKEQFEEGTKQEKKDKWVWRPGPHPQPFPQFPEIPDEGSDDIPIPPQDKIVDDPFIPADESEEAEDEGEDVDDPPRDRFDTPPPDFNCMESLVTGNPCGTHAFRIQTQKFSKATSNSLRQKNSKKHNRFTPQVQVPRMGKSRHSNRKHNDYLAFIGF